MARNKIGFNFGSQSSADGWGDCVRTLDKSGIPAVLMSSGGEGFGDIEGVWDNGSLVPHVAVIRCLTHNDVPMYGAPIDVAVEDWLNRYVPTIGGDVNKYHERVLTKHGNELDRNQIEWLAQFYEALHPALLERMGWTSHRIVCFSFSGGSPEPEDWESIKWFLELAGRNPDKWVIGVHEYSFDDENIWNGNGSLVGRFRMVYEIADRDKFPRPKIAIHEFGWRDIKIPDTTEQAMKDVDEVAALYSSYEDVLGAGIWTLQKWQGSGIRLEVQKLIEPITQLTLNNHYDCCNEPETPPVPENPLAQIWNEGRALVCVNPNTDAALQKEMFKDGWNPTGPEGQTTIGEQVYVIQPADVWAVDQPRVYFVKHGDWGNVTYIEEEDAGSGSNPLTGLKLGRLFNEPYRLTDPFNAPRSYPGNHEGGDYSTGVMGSNVLATYGGTVTFSRDTETEYGNYVIVEHVRNGSIFSTWYCHLGSRHVNVGGDVAMGVSVGTMGASGNTDGAHTHFNLQAPSYGLDGYVVPDVVDPHPYLDMNTPPSSSFDMADYFLPKDGNFSDLFMLKNNWGGGDERTQLQSDGAGHSYVVKNQQYEERFITEGRVFFLKDTSPGDNKYYTIDSDTGWMPRRWDVGDSFTRTEWVRWFDKGNCMFVSENGSNSDLVFARHYPVWVSDSDITLKDVIELEWHVGGIVDERYFYAPNLGLVGWEKFSGEKSWIHELIPLGSQENNVREIGCFS